MKILTIVRTKKMMIMKIVQIDDRILINMKNVTEN